MAIAISRLEAQKNPSTPREESGRQAITHPPSPGTPANVYEVTQEDVLGPFRDMFAPAPEKLWIPVGDEEHTKATAIAPAPLGLTVQAMHSILLTVDNGDKCSMEKSFTQMLVDWEGMKPYFGQFCGQTF